MLVRLMSGCQM